MARVLGVGIATLDIINTVEGYPAEDAEVRASAQTMRRGGNATNTLVVLSQLGHACAWAWTYAEEPDVRWILDDLAQHAVSVAHCRVLAQGKVPTSYICLNQRNGSRTIVHYRDLPEFSFADFARIVLSDFDWLHFEGRNVAETQRMMQWARQAYPSLRLSLEAEKPRPGLEACFPLADVILFSRQYAIHYGHTQAKRLLVAMRDFAPQANLVCAWGEAGAYALGHDGQHWHSPAYPPVRVVETLGAGDTFNAGSIHGLCVGMALPAALDFACRLAGYKCGQSGFSLTGFAGIKKGRL